MQWAVKNGYLPKKEDAQLFEDVLKSPGRFNIREVQDGLDEIPKKRIYSKAEPQPEIKISFEKILSYHT